MKIFCLLLVVVCCAEAAPRKCCPKANNPNRSVCYRSLNKFVNDPTPIFDSCDNPCRPFTAYCDVATCTECGDAKCYDDYCACKARFFLGDQEVSCDVATN